MSSRLAYYYCGFLILASMVIGGGTFPGLWTDHLFQVLAIPAILIGFWKWNTSRLDGVSRLLVILIIVVLVVQFLPVSRQWPNLEGFESTRTFLFTPVPQRSLEAALFTLSLLGFGLYVSNMTFDRIDGLARFFILGMIVNTGIALAQLSFPDDVRQETFLPYVITAGFFANENHFSTLAFSIIPLLAWRQLAKTARPFLFFAAIVVLAVTQFAVGSRAGMGLVIIAGCLTMIWVFGHGRRWKWPVVLCIISLVFVSALVVLFSVGLDEIAPFREKFWARTWQAFLDHMLFGSGLGSFPVVHPMYEARDQIISEFGLRAHNDPLQLLLEIGIFVLPLFAVFGFRMLVAFQGNLQVQLYALAVCMIVLHSFVDFPLRTYAISIYFTYLVVFVCLRREAR